MATANLTIGSIYWSNEDYYDWEEHDELYSGLSGSSYYFTRVPVTVPSGLTIVSTTKLVVDVPLTTISSPKGCIAVLSDNGKIASTKVQTSGCDGPSDTLTAAALATSRAYLDTSKSSLAGINVAAGTHVYFVFSGMSLTAGTTYYLYFLRSPTDDYTGSGWTECKPAASNLAVTLTYVNYTKCTAPTTFTATPNPFEETVTLNWSGAKAGTSNSIQSYLIQYADSSDGTTWGSWTTLKTVISPNTSGSATDTPDIDRGYYRKYRIRTQGSAGSDYYSGYSSAIPQVQKNRLPTAPASLSVNSTLIASGTTVTVTWPAGSDSDSNLSGYVLQLSTNGGSTYSQVQSGTSRTYSQSLTGDAGTKLRFRVRSVDSLGAVSSWRYSSYITINSAPSAPTLAQMDKNEYSPGDTVTVTWSGASDADSNISGYRIAYRPDENVEWTVLDTIDSTETSGSYSFQPDQAEYQRRIYLAVRTVDALGAMSDWKSAGSLYRNDNPYVYVRGDEGTAFDAESDKCLVGICEETGSASSFSSYMPYIFDGESWQRCIE